MDSHSSRPYVTIRLKQPTRIQRGSRHRIPIWSCFRAGFTLPLMLPSARCALTAPFHPYLCLTTIGGIFSAALSVGFRPPGITWRSYPVKSGLSSPCKQAATAQPAKTKHAIKCIQVQGYLLLCSITKIKFIFLTTNRGC